MGAGRPVWRHRQDAMVCQSREAIAEHVPGAWGGGGGMLKQVRHGPHPQGRTSLCACVCVHVHERQRHRDKERVLGARLPYGWDSPSDLRNSKALESHTFQN